MRESTSNSQVLIIDDDVKLCRLIGEYLTPFGFAVKAVHTGNDGVIETRASDYDVVILDIMLPGIDGFEVLRQIRAFSDVPVLMLTALGDEADRIVGLEIGADDYLPKTFSTRELLARLRAVTRRSQLAGRHTGVEEIESAGVYLNTATRAATHHGQQLDLTALEFDLLVLLMRNAGRVLNRDQILDEIAGREYDVFDRSIDVHISSLRRKLGDDFKDPRYIRTLRSVGYMFVGESGGGGRMLGIRFSLFSKIMFWFFLNLLLLAAIFLLIFGLSFRFEPWSPLFGGTGNRLEAVSRLISSEIDEKSRAERDEILKRYSEAYKVDFLLFDNKGIQLAGPVTALPESVASDITKPEGFGPVERNANIANARGPGGLPPPGPPPSVSIRTDAPTFYWLIMRTITFNVGDQAPIRSRLIVKSDSYYGYGLFFDPRPWIAVALIVLLVSILFWLPFVRRITRSIGQMTRAAKTIADEDFSIRVDNRRTDELGRLGSSINDLAERLSGFVNGQKRFLGDISHELNSPLARMQFALSILEERAHIEDHSHIKDVKEEVELMSKLVGELLSFSKTGIQGAAVRLEPINLKELVELVIDREIGSDKRHVYMNISVDILVESQPELMFRAVANVVRNAIAYSPENGIIRIDADRNDKSITLSISDDGPGVPGEMLEKIFDPLFRVQDDRSRSTGGTGLGLAIVKTCVEACGGRVAASNHLPHGLTIAISLRSA